VTALWRPDWEWSLPLIAVTVTLHVAGIIGIGVLVAHVRVLAEERHVGRTASALLAIAMIGTVGWILAILFGVEAALWAGVYLLLGAIKVPADAMLYSVDCMTTLGSTDALQLPRQWKLMGALEAANGVLLFGISTAFLATVLSEFRSWLPGRADLK